MKEAEDKGYWNTEWKTVPQMWLYKKHIGGYNEYVAMKTSLSAEPSYENCSSCEA
jgi:glutaredoxin-related protein